MVMIDKSKRDGGGSDASSSKDREKNGKAVAAREIRCV
jgi:hypothetical protein